MAEIWCDLPMVICPHCGKEFQLDDYWDLGNSFDCNECQKEIYILQTNTVVSVCLGTEKE